MILKNIKINYNYLANSFIKLYKTITGPHMTSRDLINLSTQESKARVAKACNTKRRGRGKAKRRGV